MSLENNLREETMSLMFFLTGIIFQLYPALCFSCEPLMITLFLFTWPLSLQALSVSVTYNVHLINAACAKHLPKFVMRMVSKSIVYKRQVSLQFSAIIKALWQRKNNKYKYNIIAINLLHNDVS